jgi:hypothetical protein
VFTQPTLAVPVRPDEASDQPAVWRWSQHWRDLLFAHWRIPARTLRPLVPAELDLDTWEGTAWVTAVAFRLEQVRVSWFPACRLVPNFVELNLRTHVRRRGEPAIYFVSMHANSRIGVTLGRWFTPLPYAFAPIDYTDSSKFWRFHAHQRSARSREPLFRAEFQPNAPLENVDARSLDGWLLERYVAFNSWRRGKLYRMTAQHPPWQAQTLRAQVTARALGQPWAMDLGRAPDLCHFSPGVHARVGRLELIRGLCG